MNLSRAQSRKVMIGTPVSRAPALEYAMAYGETCAILERLGIERQTYFLAGQANLPRARNQICAHFLASEYTDLIMIDDDMGWEPDAIVRLLASEHQVLAAVGRQRRDDPSWCVSLLPGGEHDDDGAIEVKAVGAAMLKIERDVLGQMAAAHPEWKQL